MITDWACRFLLEKLDIRGALVCLGPVWQKMVENRQYPAHVLQLLGEICAVGVLLGGNLNLFLTPYTQILHFPGRAES